MASKAVSTVSLFLILALAVSPTLSYANKPDSSRKKASSVEFLKHLQGCHKGEKVKGIHKLKTYLETFGYASYNHAAANADNDEFDDYLELAVKNYQVYHKLKATGTLDAPTVSKMMMPRCGVSDIINGNTRMQSGKKGHHNHRKFRTVSHYSFFRGNPRWPASKSQLTYAFLPKTPTQAIGPVRSAFAKWESATHFSFLQTQDNANADLNIGFFHGDHGDGAPFDGPGYTIAHAFSPQIQRFRGHFHYDAHEKFSVGRTQTTFHLETVALHEIGHLLGLDHSRDQDAIMYPEINVGEVKDLHPDDLQGIRTLYNV